MKLALFDFDGTLSDDRARRPAYEAQDWPAYWDKDAMLSEPAWPKAQALVAELIEDGWQVGLLTARLDHLNREVTEKWLITNELYLTPVIMRDEHNEHLRPSEFKLQALKMLGDWMMYDEIVLYDNDKAVVDLVTEELGPDWVVHTTWEPAENEPA